MIKLQVRDHKGMVRTVKAETGLKSGEGKIAKCWASRKWYEHAMLEFIRRKRYRGSCIDIGANIGNHTLHFSIVCGLKVYAFEPILHEVLSSNIALNGANATVYPVALGAKAETASHVGKGKLQVGEGEFPVVPLDQYKLWETDKRISMIKADCEGMESQAFQGAKMTLTKCSPDIYAEQWTDTEHNQIKSVLCPLGYRMVRVFSSKSSATPVGLWQRR